MLRVLPADLKMTYLAKSKLLVNLKHRAKIKIQTLYLGKKVNKNLTVVSLQKTSGIKLNN
jgi:hypothetical protein